MIQQNRMTRISRKDNHDQEESVKMSHRAPLLALFALGFFLTAGCTSTGSFGLLSSSETEADLGPHDSHKFHRVGGQIEGTACRHFILGLVPWGDSDLETAMKDAFKKNPSLHADGLVHVTTSTSLYNFFPLYNVYTLTCTTVRGIPVRFDHTPEGKTKKGGEQMKKPSPS